MALTLWSAFVQIAIWGTERSAFLWNCEDAPYEVVRLRARTALVGTVVSVPVMWTLELLEYMPAVALAAAWMLVDREYEFRRVEAWILAGLPRLVGAYVLLALVVAGSGGPLCLGSMAAAQLLTATLVARRCASPVSDRGSDLTDRRSLRGAMRWMGTTSALWPAIYFADQALLAKVKGYSVTADYALAYKLLMPLIACFALSQAVFVPRLGTSSEAYSRYRLTNAILAVLTLGSVGFIALLSAHFANARTAILLIALSPQLAVIALTDPQARMLAATGRSKAVSAADFAAFSTAALLYVALIPPFGATGAIAATLAAHGVYALTLLEAGRRGARRLDLARPSS